MGCLTLRNFIKLPSNPMNRLRLFAEDRLNEERKRKFITRLKGDLEENFMQSLFSFCCHQPTYQPPSRFRRRWSLIQSEKRPLPTGNGRELIKNVKQIVQMRHESNKFPCCGASQFHSFSSLCFFTRPPKELARLPACLPVCLGW